MKAKVALPKKHDFRGLKYRIAWRKPRRQPRTCLGTCDSPGKAFPKRMIEIHPGMRATETRLRVLIDEAIHACFWDLDNDSVGSASSSIASFLWRCGVRFTK